MAKQSKAEKVDNSVENTWPEQHGLAGEHHKAYSALIRCYNITTRKIECMTRNAGALPLEWYDILLVLEYAPEGRLRVGDLACHVVLSRSGLTRLVDRLEAAGYVERKLNPSDRRSFEVILTPEGRAAREQTWPLYARAIAEIFGSHYSTAEAERLTELLERTFDYEYNPIPCNEPRCGGPTCEETPCDDSDDN